VTEVTQQILAISKLLVIVLCGSLYAVGGFINKFYRRFLVPIIVALAVVGFGLAYGRFNFFNLLYPIGLCIGLHIGYGGEGLWERIFKRLFYGLLVSLPVLVFGFTGGSWLLAGFHIVLFTSASVCLGVWNPVDARQEETILGSLSVLLPIFMI